MSGHSAELAAQALGEESFSASDKDDASSGGSLDFTGGRSGGGGNASPAAASASGSRSVSGSRSGSGGLLARRRTVEDDDVSDHESFPGSSIDGMDDGDPSDSSNNKF